MNNASSEARHQLLHHIYSSRRIYETIVHNMQHQDEILFDVLGVTRGRGQSLWEPSPGINASATPATQGQQPGSNRWFANGTPYGGIQRTNVQQGNPFDGLFTDITNLIFNGAGSANEGMSNEQISVALMECSYGDLPPDVRERYTTCPVTLDQFENNMEVAVIRACGHVFRRGALMNWLANHHTCPSCRRNLNEPVVEGPRPAAPAAASASPSGNAPHRQNQPAAQLLSHNVSRTEMPGQQESFEFQGVFGVPSSVGDETEQQRLIASALERMFGLPELSLQGANGGSGTSATHPHVAMSLVGGLGLGENGLSYTTHRAQQGREREEEEEEEEDDDRIVMDTDSE